MAAVDQRTYYEILNVSKTATKAEIKKSYYALSRVLHPDKCPDNPNAEEMFKQVSQAYQVLMDDSKRELYDRYGKDAVSSSNATNFDLKEMLGMLFGGGKFENEFGEISFAAVMNAQPAGQSAEEDAKLKEELDKVQAERRQKLVYKLLIKLEPFVQNEIEGFDAIASADVAEKIDAPGGPALLDHIAYIYIQEAKQHLKRFLGIESFFANLSEKGHYLIEGLDVVRHAVKYQLAEKKLQTEPSSPHLQKTATESGLKALWKLGKLEIEQMVRSVCEEVLRDTNIEPQLRKKRAEGLMRLGELYQQAAKPLLEHLKQKAKTPRLDRSTRGSTQENNNNNNNAKEAQPTPNPFEELRDFHSQLL